MFSARQNWSTVKLASLTSARFAPRAGLCSKDTLRLHVYSYLGTCITPDAQKNPRRNIPLVGRGVINPLKQRAASDRSTAAIYGYTPTHPDSARITATRIASST